ncbi:MAG: hypothetical protein H7Y00_10290 [Fimbriimonadaceae bacterium]|nr:hypothetical protein [Chitinophagales bacterium]
MRGKILSLSVCAAIIISFSGCYYDVDEILYGTSSCDTTIAITYADFIAPLLDDNCNACHSETIASGGVITDNYASVKTIADNGKLYGAISHAPGYVAMPKNGNKLDDCTISQVKKWIDSGVLDN